MTDASYQAEQINEKLIGATITRSIYDPDNDLFGFIVGVAPSERMVWVLQDAEGNGEGWLDIVENDDEERPE